VGFTVGPLENGTLRAAKWMHRDPFQKEKEKGTLIKGSQVDSQKVPKKGLLWKNRKSQFPASERSFTSPMWNLRWERVFSKPISQVLRHGEL